MILLSHPTGNQNVRAAALAFLQAGWLQEFDVCFSWDPTIPWARWIPPRIAHQLERRSFPDIPRELQSTHPWRELGRLVAQPLPFLNRFNRSENSPLSIDQLYWNFDRYVSSRLPSLAGAGLKAVYAYEDGSLSTFQVAKTLGLRRFYDLPIGYWRAARQIYEEERELQPEWACTLTGLQDSDEKLARKDLEISLAEVIIVPSSFVRDTLISHNATSAPVIVTPFGSPSPLAEPPIHQRSGPLQVLFVGGLSQRKGLSYLFDAIDQCGDDVQLTVVGKGDPLHCRPLADALSRHRWMPSLTHDGVLEQMRLHDVLVLPSLFEGYALVISEALSQGLPVIATPNSGATHSIRDGLEGWIVPIRDSQAIADRISELSSSRDQLLAMREACLRRAAELSWAHYQTHLVQALAPFLIDSPKVSIPSP